MTKFLTSKAIMTAHAARSLTSKAANAARYLAPKVAMTAGVVATATDMLAPVASEYALKQARVPTMNDDLFVTMLLC